MQTTIRALLGAALVVGAFGVAVAKLPPAPPLTDEQKAAKAAEDHAVSKYIADQKAKGITVTPQLPPGPPPSADGAKSLPAQPEKASNAHSPPQK